MVFSPPFPKLGAQRVGPNPFSSSPSLPPSPPWPTSQALALSTLRAAFLPVEHLTINAFSQVPPSLPPAPQMTHTLNNSPVEAVPPAKFPPWPQGQSPCT